MDFGTPQRNVLEMNQGQPIRKSSTVHQSVVSRAASLQPNRQRTRSTLGRLKRKPVGLKRRHRRSGGINRASTTPPPRELDAPSPRSNRTRPVWIRLLLPRTREKYGSNPKQSPDPAARNGSGLGRSSLRHRSRPQATAGFQARHAILELGGAQLKRFAVRNRCPRLPILHDDAQNRMAHAVQKASRHAVSDLSRDVQPHFAGHGTRPAFRATRRLLDAPCPVRKMPPIPTSAELAKARDQAFRAPRQQAASAIRGGENQNQGHPPRRRLAPGFLVPNEFF